MKKILIGAALSLLVAVPAIAADMPVKAPPVVVTTVNNWSGFYIGAVGSHNWADAQHCSVVVPCQAGFPRTDMRGWMGGLTVGANYQADRVVFGIEGDWSGGRLRGSSPSTPGYNCVGTCDNAITSVATLRGRLGLAYNQFLGYVTAGVAWERLQASLGSPVALVNNTTSRSNFVWGFGAEMAFTNNWSGKIEYLRTTQLGTFVYDNNGTCAAVCNVVVRELSLLRFGVNYRFGGPVIARY